MIITYKMEKECKRRRRRRRRRRKISGLGEGKGWVTRPTTVRQ